MTESGQTERKSDKGGVGTGRPEAGGVVESAGRRAWYRRMSAVHTLTAVIVATALMAVLVIFSTFCVVESVGIGSPLRRRMSDNQSIIAEVMPPPQHIAAAYAAMHELEHPLSAGEVERIIADLLACERAFKRSSAIWEKRLAAEPETLVHLSETASPAKEIFRIAREEALPALRRGDLAMVGSIRSKQITPLYYQHNEATARLVRKLKADHVELERHASAAQRRVWWVQGGIGLVVLVMIGGGATLVLRQVRAPLREMSAALRNLESTPEESLARLSEYPGEFGVLGATLRTLMQEQQRARRQAERLAEIARRTQSAVLITDRAGLIEWTNEGFTRLTGYTAEEAVGKAAAALLRGPKTDQGEAARVDRAVEAGVAVNAEVVNYTKEKREYIVRVEVEPLRDANGTVTGFMSVETDVSEAREREAALIEAEQQFRTLVNNIPGATYRCLLDSAWTMLFVSDAVEELTGYPAADFLGNDVRTFDSIIHPDDRLGVSESVHAAVARNASFTIEYRVLHCNGTVRWVREKGRSAHSESGVHYLDGTIFDVTASKEAQRRVAESEALQRSVLATMAEGIIVQDPTGTIISCNPSAEQILGLSFNQITGRTSILADWRAIREDLSDMPGHEHPAMVTLRTGEPLRGIVMGIFKPDGERIWIRVNTDSIMDEDGTVTAVVASIADITSERRAGHELAQQRLQTERLALVARRTQNAVVVTDAQGRIEWVNDAFTQMTGYLLDEIRGVKPGAFLQGAQTDPLQIERMSRAIAAARGTEVEVVNYTKFGKEFIVQIEIEPLNDERGVLTGFMAMQLDVTEQRASEKVRREQQELLEGVMSVIPYGVFWKDVGSRFLGCNRQFAEFAGVGDPESIVGKSDYDLSWTAEKSEAHVADDRRVMTTGEPNLHVMEALCARDGREIWLDTSKVPIRDESGSVIGVLGVFADVTAMKQQQVELARAKEAADAASSAKSQFLANMSHEIRTPLTAILGYADVLRDDLGAGSSGEKSLQTVETIRGAGQHLLTIINDVLDLSRIEAGKMEVERVEVDFAGLMEEIGSMLRPRATGKGVGFSVVFRTPVPSRVMSDPTRLRQVLLNLGGNACKFTEAGAVTIGVDAVMESGVCSLTIDVEDTGVGMTSEQVGRLFMPFSQADASMTRRFGGTGLGLAISKRLVMLMGGDVVIVRTAAGQGTTFRVSLRLEPAPGATMVQNPGIVRRSMAPAPATKIALQGRILLAEDGPDNQRLIALHLRKAGAEVDIAENGKVAMEKIEAAEGEGRPYALLISDMQMPVMDGYALARALRARGSRLAVLALTAHAMSEDRRLCLESGCDDYASKPIDKAALLGTCAKWIGREGGTGNAKAAA